MKELIIGILLFLNCCGYLHSQSGAIQEQINYDAVLGLAIERPDDAIALADSLYQYATEDKYKIKSLLISADIYRLLQNDINSIQNAKEALVLARKTGQNAEELEALLFLSSGFRNIDLNSIGKRYLDQAVALVGSINNQKEGIKYRAEISQERAEYARIDNDFKGGLNFARHSVLLYQMLPPDAEIAGYIASAKSMEAMDNMNLNRNDDALVSSMMALNLLKNSNLRKSLEEGRIYQNHGEILLKTGNNDSSINYLDQALKIAENLNNNQLKKEVFANFKNHYRLVNNMEMYMSFVDKYDSVSSMGKNEKLAAINYLTEIGNLQKDKVSDIKPVKAFKMPSIVVKREYFYWLGGGILLFLFSLILIKLWKSRPVKAVEIKPLSATTHPVQVKTSENNELSQETIDRIKVKLDEFEREENFLDKEMSFSTLVGEVETNDKYLNRYFKDVLDLNYNTYINNLRIHYIVDKLNTDPSFRSYKLTYLAEECGFSSYSAFTVNFKNIMKESPSTYLEKLK